MPGAPRRMCVIQTFRLPIEKGNDLLQQSFLTRRDAKFQLRSLALSPAQPSVQYQVAPETLRLICPMSGTCQLVTQEARTALVGSRMVLLCGSLTYTLEDVRETCMLAVLDFYVADAASAIYSPYRLCQHYSCYCAYCQFMPQILVVEDSLGIILSKLHVLQTCIASAPAEPLSVHVELTLIFIMLYCTSIAHEKCSKDVYCSKHTRHAIRYINNNYMQPISIKYIAAQVGVHPNYLHRRFAAEMGTQPLKYLTELRLEKAKYLLVDTKVPIAEIARRIGIVNRQHFSKVFHSHVGMSPLEYRRSYNFTCDYATALDALEYTRHYLSATEEP